MRRLSPPLAVAAVMVMTATASAQPAPASSSSETPYRRWSVSAGYEVFSLRDISRNTLETRTRITGGGAAGVIAVRWRRGGYAWTQRARDVRYANGGPGNGMAGSRCRTLIA